MKINAAKVQILKHDEWQDIKLKKIKHHDIFRLIGSYGWPVDYEMHMARCDAYKKKKRWTVKVVGGKNV